MYSSIYLKTPTFTNIIVFFLGADFEFLLKKFNNLSLKDTKGSLNNISFLLELSVKYLYLGVGFSYITNIFKGKRKIKNIILQPKYIFGYDRMKQTLKNLSSQFLKTQRVKGFTRLVKDSKNEITVKESLSLQSRLN